VLPGPTYTKGFLRAYAEFLELDGQLFIDEFNSRHYDPRGEIDREIYPRSRARAGRRHRRESNIVLMVLAAIVAVSALIFLGFQSSPPTANYPVVSTPSTSTTSAPTTPVTHPKTTPTKHHKAKHSGTKPAQRAFTVAITAAGPCWMTAHVGSPTGAGAVSVKGTDLTSYELAAGVVATIRSTKPLYLTFGAPGSISSITVDGKAASVPYAPSGAVLEVTRTGIVRA
jgi:cytoskeletal protein RodZ